MPSLTLLVAFLLISCIPDLSCFISEFLAFLSFRMYSSSLKFWVSTPCKMRNWCMLISLSWYRLSSFRRSTFWLSSKYYSSWVKILLMFLYWASKSYSYASCLPYTLCFSKLLLSSEESITFERWFFSRNWSSRVRTRYRMTLAP